MDLAFLSLVVFGMIAAAVFTVVCFNLFLRAVMALGDFLDRCFKRHRFWDMSLLLILYLLFTIGVALLLVRFFQYLMVNPIGMG